MGVPWGRVQSASKYLPDVQHCFHREGDTMVRREVVNSLPSEIGNRLKRLSEAQHRLARDHRILTDATHSFGWGRVPRPCWPRSESRARTYWGITATCSSQWLRRLCDRLAASRHRCEGGRCGRWRTCTLLGIVLIAMTVTDCATWPAPPNILDGHYSASAPADAARRPTPAAP